MSSLRDLLYEQDKNDQPGALKRFFKEPASTLGAIGSTVKERWKGASKAGKAGMIAAPLAPAAVLGAGYAGLRVYKKRKRQRKGEEE